MMIWALKRLNIGSILSKIIIHKIFIHKSQKRLMKFSLKIEFKIKKRLISVILILIIDTLILKLMRSKRKTRLRVIIIIRIQIKRAEKINIMKKKGILRFWILKNFLQWCMKTCSMNLNTKPIFSLRMREKIWIQLILAWII